MINYAAKAKRAYLINNFDKILNSLNTLHSTVETMTLFVNDQAYNYILKLKGVVKGGPMYRHNVKRFLNEMDKEIKRYNASIYYINKERSEVIADITQAMEDCLMPYIDDLAGAIKAAVWSRGCVRGADGSGGTVPNRILLGHDIRQTYLRWISDHERNGWRLGW